MTPLVHQIRSAQRRLWLNRWLGLLAWSVAVGGFVYAAVVLIQRLFDLPIPLGYVGLGLAVTTLLLSIVWAVAMREGALAAAAALDQAAGLRERLSSGHLCTGSDDPLAKAVVVDAERIASSITARQHIRLQAPRALAAGLGSLVLAALMFLITPGLLLSDETVEAKQQEESVRLAQVAVKRQMKEIKDIVDATPALDDLKDEAAKLDIKQSGQLGKPEDLRYEAAKKIDNLADAVKRKQHDSKYDALRDMRKRLRSLKAPSEESPTQKLTKALQQGDFKEAKEEVKALQEQLATLKKEKDQKAIDKLSKQLDSLAKQLEKLDSEEKLKEKLEQAGIKKDDVDRALESLKKKDLEQIKKSLQQKGMDQQSAEKLAKQIKQSQGAGSMAKKLAQAMKMASQAASSGQQGQAAAGLSSAGEQLDQLEQLEQEMNQLESTMSDLQQARNKMGNGTGQCNNPGGGMRKKRRGRGGIAPEEQTDVAFKTEHGKVKTTKGAIIAQFLVDGEQVKGEVTSDFVNLMTAAQHDASDRISRDRIPRQYQKAVKSYFSNVQKSLEEMKNGKASKKKAEKPADESSSKPHTD